MNKITTGPAREKIDLAELQQAKPQGTIITDDRRRRPLWFDGRFLDAQALNAEQNYFLARQADYGRVAGFGVITGLGVRAHSEKARTVVIDAGHGLTPSGSQVVLPEQLSVDLANVAEGQQLDASFGLSEIPRASPFNRSGLYIVALRTVEYTGNPISSYPTHVDAPRTTHDGSVIEATAVTLIPYPDPGAATELEQRRSHVAREIFYEESLKGQPEDVLPLAMLALDHGIIRWLDMFMVRREIAQRERNVWGLGISPRPLRAAHLRQYSVQLNELQQQLGSGARISASEHFPVLPPAGPMPASGVNGDDFSHSFFPAEMDVELSIVPEDELPALLEDAMLLPPLDLELTGAAQESTSVLVVMPVPRHQFRSLSQSLPTISRELPAAQPGMIAKRKPITALSQLLSRRRVTAMTPAEASADSQWRTELSKLSQLWYLRRRNLHYKAEVTSWSVEIRSAEREFEEKVTERINGLNLKTRFNSLLSRATTTAAAELTSFLASPMMLGGSDAAVRAAVTELEKAEEVDSRDVMKVAERFSEPGFGEGLARLEKADEHFSGNTRVMENLAKSGKLPELDRLSRTLPKAEFETLTKELADAGSGNDAAAVEKVSKVIEEKAGTTEVRSGPVVNKPVSFNPRIGSTLTRR
ncbi:hypothetical protein Tel_12070 [Candidatus Tenderia electrophaga]|jgi:hypothetical protein|uniref:Uncharacterized protein n=1 Tax=Candidatus Tenderia electrophaga TaxID=1748243 RepID=A0A0S2TF78_9GAMM|nr:hypothetical protein Tel_12070 [Candidatus Tenderia electrophaga]